MGDIFAYFIKSMNHCKLCKLVKITLNNFEGERNSLSKHKKHVTVYCDVDYSQKSLTILVVLGEESDLSVRPEIPGFNSCSPTPSAIPPRLRHRFRNICSTISQPLRFNLQRSNLRWPRPRASRTLAGQMLTSNTTKTWASVFDVCRSKKFLLTKIWRENWVFQATAAAAATRRTAITCSQVLAGNLNGRPSWTSLAMGSKAGSYSSNISTASSSTNNSINKFLSHFRGQVSVTLFFMSGKKVYF